MHKGEVLFFSLVYTIKRAIQFLEVKANVQNEPLKFRENIDMMCMLHPIHIFIHNGHIVIVLNNYPIQSY